ncbi:MAG: sigma-70 family RNA polymerase sigma factor [Candidatus Poribacteria bacterium]|nr:sigma-70 family RNA polymerase sigma factor [Candidatus Poribacteria bacterium]
MRALIQKLLSKLREADRTVIRLYYLAEMTCEEISKFLGVSQNTIKSRLSRARKRLKKQAEAIEHTLCSFRLSFNFVETLLVNLAFPILGMQLSPVKSRSFYLSKYYR